MSQLLGTGASLAVAHYYGFTMMLAFIYRIVH
jgi:hypothetical protein